MKAITKMIGTRVKIDASELALKERLIAIDRITKVVKGGRRLRFRALVTVGDDNGHVGVGLAKATGVPEAIRKAGVMARKEIIEVPIINGTIPHEILAKFGASKILLKPASPGSGLIASNTARAVLESAGVRDVIGKSLGSSNKINAAKATILALASLRKVKEEMTEGETEMEITEVEANETE